MKTTSFPHQNSILEYKLYNIIDQVKVSDNN